MSLTALAFVVASSLYLGFQWTIRAVVYPQFARVGALDFAGYERQHQRLDLAVGPLFAAVALTSSAVAIDPPAAAPRWAAVTAPILFAVLLGVTGLRAVPLHRRLSSGYDAAAHRELLRVDSVRLLVASVSVALAVFLVQS